MSGNGKGDAPRNCFSEDFRNNYDQIFRKAKRAKAKEALPIIAVPVAPGKGSTSKIVNNKHKPLQA